jgi:hypothetical protein
MRGSRWPRRGGDFAALRSMRDYADASAGASRVSGSTLFVSGLFYELARAGVPASNIRIEMPPGCRVDAPRMTGLSLPIRSSSLLRATDPRSWGCAICCANVANAPIEDE